jgi:Transmembrane domain of unknown function (DUF3566)
LDRGTDRPDGSGSGTPTVVTSRATDDDLIGDEQETPPSGVMAPPRLSSPRPATARSASVDTEPQDDAVADGTAGGVSANGASASGKDSSVNGGPAALDDTIVDGVPALPADTIGSARDTRPKESDPGQAAPAGAGDAPTVGFGPRPYAPVPSSTPVAADWTAAGAARPAVSDSASPSSAAPAGIRPSGPGSPGPASPGTVPPGRPSPAGSPSVSPAAFAWETADGPATSPVSPARNFLRSGLTLRAAAAKGGSSDTGQTATSAGPAPARGATQQAPAQQVPAQQAPAQKASSQKVKSKRTARQAHLTIARVEPWSVMKLSFVVSLVAFVILFIAVSLLYGVLSAVGVFNSLQHVVTSLTSSQGSAGVNAKAWFSASKVLGYTALLGSANIVLITAMSTIGAVVYNLTSRLVGGVEVTLRETD